MRDSCNLAVMNLALLLVCLWVWLLNQTTFLAEYTRVIRWLLFESATIEDRREGDSKESHIKIEAEEGGSGSSSASEESHKSEPKSVSKRGAGVNKKKADKN